MLLYLYTCIPKPTGSIGACLQVDRLVLRTCVGSLRTIHGQCQCQHLTVTLISSANLKYFKNIGTQFSTENDSLLL